MNSSFGWHKKLRETDDFSSVFHFRCTQRGQVLDVSAGPNGQSIARLGLIVPKRQIPTAVGRNRIKRVLRESFRLHQDELTGLDIIARLKAKPAQEPNTQAEQHLLQEFMNGLAACRTCVLRRRPDLFPV